MIYSNLLRSTAFITLLILSRIFSRFWRYQVLAVNLSSTLHSITHTFIKHFQQPTFPFFPSLLNNTTKNRALSLNFGAQK